MKQLEVILSMIDKFSRPLKQAQGALTSFTGKSKENFKTIGMGAAALWGAGLSVKAFLGPAYEMQSALNDVKSLGVSDDAIKKLSDTALNFSMKFGGNAADVVRSAYDIQGAIDGLNGDELSSFTVASGVLAKSTKADVGVITNYMGTMYGIFQDTADRMGRAKWVEEIAGQTAMAVKIFKSSGDEMSAAFTSLGAAGTSAGRSAAEQMAVLGQLQATMSGSEAGTKYKAFLAGVGTAQKTLGLSFVDSQGKMKGVTDILSLIRNKFGDLSNVKNSDLVKKAFGSDEAVAMIKLMIGNVDSLSGSIDTLQKTTGMEDAAKMAQVMIDPWERLEAIWFGIRAVIGRTLIPVLNPVLEKIAGMGTQFGKWMQMFPNIARWIGYIVVGMLALAAVAAVITILTGLFALLTSPILLIIAAIAILTWAIYDQYKYWSWALTEIGKDISALWTSIWAAIQSGWAAVVAFFQGLSPVEAFKEYGNTIMGVFASIWASIKDSALSSYNWIVKMLNKIPGIDISLAGGDGAGASEVPGGAAAQLPAGTTAPLSLGGAVVGVPAPVLTTTGAPMLTGGIPINPGKNGIAGTMTENNTNRGKNLTIGKVEMNVTNPMTPQELQERTELYGWGG